MMTRECSGSLAAGSKGLTRPFSKTPAMARGLASVSRTEYSQVWKRCLLDSGPRCGANMTYDVASPTVEATPSQYVATGIDTMARAIRLTQSLFPGVVRVEVEQDPEIPDDSYLVFNVTAEGPLADVVSRRLQWHEQVRGLIPDAAQRLRLSVDAKA